MTQYQLYVCCNMPHRHPVSVLRSSQWPAVACCVAASKLNCAGWHCMKSGHNWSMQTANKRQAAVCPISHGTHAPPIIRRVQY